MKITNAFLICGLLLFGGFAGAAGGKRITFTQGLYSSFGANIGQQIDSYLMKAATDACGSTQNVVNIEHLVVKIESSSAISQNASPKMSNPSLFFTYPTISGQATARCQ